MNKHERYNHSEKGRERYQRYQTTPKGELTELKKVFKRNLSRNQIRIEGLESRLESQIQNYMELLNAEEN